MSELADLSVAQLLDHYRTRKASPLEAVDACLARIDRLEPSINAITTLVADRSRELAAESGKRWMSRDHRPLEGIPFGLKDIIATAGVGTTGGSRLYAHYVPPETAAVAERLEAAGGLMVAKLQTFELAFGTTTDFGVTHNPWDLGRTPGGSSSGSAAAVAARMLPLAIGTDTGGSIRIPASFCALTGLKPTYGRVPRHGVFPLSWTLDHVGPMTRSVEDAALSLAVMAGFDPRDPTSEGPPVEDYAGALAGGVKGLRVGVPTDWFFDLCDPEIETATRQALTTLAGAGAKLVEVSLPNAKLAEPIGWMVMYAECASLHEGTLDRLDDYGKEFRDFLVAAQFVSAADYLKGLRARHVVQRDFESAFEKVDALITPGAISVAPRLSDMLSMIGDRGYPWADVISRTTFIFNVTGLPALSIPAGLNGDGVPVGIQVIARPFDEATCLRVGHAFQQLTDYHVAVPALVTSSLSRRMN
jgi:aspartyl-tRNA(Asn)/glutamyl-tRNA(Gln) amidotransferase subunit A